MKLFSDCSGECAVCACAGCCFAGHGDDEFCPASEKQLIERLAKGKYKEYTQLMKSELMNRYGYDYDKQKGEKEMPTNTTTKKTKSELLDEIKSLKDEVARLERYKKYEEMADELSAMRSSFVNAGFSADEAFKLVTTMIAVVAHTLNK